MISLARGFAALAAATAIIYTTLGPHGVAWDRPLAWCGLAALGLGWTAMWSGRGGTPHPLRVPAGDTPRD